MAEDMIAVQAAEQEADLVALMDGRARTYGLMARLFLKEVDKAVAALQRRGFSWSDIRNALEEYGASLDIDE